MKKFISGILSFIIALSILGCQNENLSDSEISVDLSSIIESSVEENILDMYAYENDEVFYVDEIELRDDLAEKCKTYEFNFLSDGCQIKAYISIPMESIKSQQPCKCILHNRGGHYNYGSLDYEYVSLVCAYTGRAVVACEIRGDNGSEGYDQFGGDELHDVFKLIVTARQDKRVKKLIVFSGVSDLFDCYDEREEKMKQVLIDCIGGSPQEMPEEYEKRSAVCWADEINIPVLIVHSRGDERVPFEQAQKMYELLKDHTDCTFITHDDDLHGIHEDDIPKVIEWLENK